MKKAIVVGASSGIGRELVLVLSKNGYEVGMTARRLGLLETLQNEVSNKTFAAYMDLDKPEEAVEGMKKMIGEMGEVELIIINAGIGFINPELDWEKEKKTINTNITGFCALAGASYNYFVKIGHGKLVGISSIGALRGNEGAPAYNASKAFMSSYLEALRHKASKANKSIIVTDIKPGYVDTEMAKGTDKFWVAPPAKAAEQIYNAILHNRTHAYITRRWRLIGWLLKYLPNCIYDRL